MAMWSRVLKSDNAKPSGVVPSLTADRVKAFIIDSLLVTIIQMPIFALAVSTADKGNMMTHLLIFVGYLVVPLLYFVMFWRLAKATPGKKLMGMIVVDEKSCDFMSWPQAGLRACAYALLAISIARSFVNPRLKLIHDEVAGTSSVYKY